MRHSEVVRQHWSATITLELAAEPRSKDDGSGEREYRRWYEGQSELTRLEN